MPAPFNTTNITNVYDLFAYANTVTSEGTSRHVFGDLLVVAVWVIVWGVFTKTSDYGATNSALKSLIVASFTAFFFSALLDVVGLVDPTFVALPFGILVLLIVIDKKMEK